MILQYFGEYPGKSVLSAKLDPLGLAVKDGVAMPYKGDPTTGFYAYHKDPSVDLSDYMIELDKQGRIDWGRGHFLLASPKFDKDELLAADYIRMWAYPRFGFPVPEFCYLSESYENSLKCPKCYALALGEVTFCLAGQPKETGLFAFELHVHNAVFLSRQLWDLIFAKLPGAFCRPVQVWPELGRKSSLCDNIVQLDTTVLTEFEFGPRDIRNICPVCEMPTYRPDPKSAFYKPTLNGFAFAKGCEFMNSGGRAMYAPFIISQDLYRELLKHKVKGLLFEPCRKK